MKIGAYELTGTLGQGGMGAVYRVRDPDGRELALKLLRAPDDATARARFAREVKLAASLGLEAGFVPILEPGEHEGQPFLVMPLLTGGTLRERLRRGPLPLPETVELGIRLGRALGRAHELGIVHRDLKPENILFDGAGRALVADLGLAKPTALDATALTASGALAGTPAYMAPEQVAATGPLGPATDVFALGAVLFECLAGRPAFTGQGLFELLSRVASAAAPDLASERPDLPPAVTSIVAKALAREPEARFADGAALARALEALRPPSRLGRHLVRLALLGVVAAVLVWRPWHDEVAARIARARGAKDPRLALADLDRAIALDAGRTEAWALRARTHVLLGDPEGAARDAKEALTRDPRNAQAWADRAWACLAVSKPQRAVSHATTAIAVEPRLSFAWAVRGRARLALRDAAGARADLDRSLGLEPNVTALIGRALIAIEERPRDAIPDLDRALELDPDHVEALALRGRARGLEGAKDLDRAVAMGSAFAHWQRALAVPGDAPSELERALALEPRLLGARLLRARLRFEGRDHAAALEDLDRAVADAPEHPGSWATRAEARIRLGDAEGAIQDATKALRWWRGNASPWASRALARLARRELDEARADLERALALDPELAQARLARAYLLADEGDSAAAREEADRVLEKVPADPLALAIRGRARLELEDVRGGIADLEKATALIPNELGPWVDLGNARERLGDVAGAIAAFERAAKLDPSSEVFERKLTELRQRTR